MADPIQFDAARAGLYYAPPLRHGRLTATASEAGLPNHSAQLGECTTLPQALEQLGQALAFPDYYGANLDALYDCLTDTDWQGTAHLVLVIGGLDPLRSADLRSFSQLVEVLSAAAEARTDAQHPCWIIIDAPARGVPHLPVQ